MFRIQIQSGQWIHIRIRIRNPDPDPGGQKWPTKIEKLFWSAGCSLFRAEGFFGFLGRPLWKPRDRYIQFMINKYLIFFPAITYFPFLVIKTLDPDWTRIGIKPKMLDPSPNQMNTDPKHCIADHLFPARKSTQLVNLVPKPNTTRIIQHPT